MKKVRLDSLNLNFEVLPENDEYYERIAAVPSQEFWTEWQSKKAEMKRKGFFVEKIGSEYAVMINISDISKYSKSLLEEVETAKANSEFSDNPIADAIETQAIEKSSDWDSPITVIIVDEKTGKEVSRHAQRTEEALTIFMQDECPTRKSNFTDNWLEKLMKAWKEKGFQPAKIFKHNGFIYQIQKSGRISREYA